MHVEGLINEFSGTVESIVTPLDLRSAPPRPVRATMCDFYFLPRTVDKLRAELPGGNLGSFLNHDRGLSAYVVRRLGLDMNEFREAVARAPNEDAVAAWLAMRVDPLLAPIINAKLETFVVERMSAEDRVLVRRHHPVLEQQPELSKLLDIIDAEDERAFKSGEGDPPPALSESP